MRSFKADELLEKYVNGTASPNERALLERWYQQQDSSGPLPALEELLDDQRISKELLMKEIGAAKRVPLWRRVGAVAAILCAIGLGAWFINDMWRSEGGSNGISVYASDVQPGRASATLTLADGKIIKLDGSTSGIVSEEGGVSIHKNADGKLIYKISGQQSNEDLSGKFNVLATASAETYQVILPDGTAVWLNAASSIKYPLSFANANERRVEITGEGYFEVAKINTPGGIPFVVKTKSEDEHQAQEIKVLGTHFNVNAYADEPDTKTSLMEGKVQVFRSGSQGSSVTLLPGQQAFWKDARWVVKAVDTEQIVDWKNGDFVFKGADFKSVMRKIARWYNVEVVYDDSLPADVQLGGWVSRESSLAVVLQQMESTGSIHFKLEGRRVTVTK